jgi:hypothetical protein
VRDRPAAGGRVEQGHDVSPPAKSPHREAAADDLAETGQVRRDPEQFLCAASVQPKALHFVQDEHETEPSRLLAQTDYGVDSTPTFFINGKKFVGALPYEDFAKALAAATADSGAHPTRFAMTAQPVHSE